MCDHQPAAAGLTIHTTFIGTPIWQKHTYYNICVYIIIFQYYNNESSIDSWFDFLWINIVYNKIVIDFGARAKICDPGAQNVQIQLYNMESLNVRYYCCKIQGYIRAFYFPKKRILACIYSLYLCIFIIYTHNYVCFCQIY